MSNLPGGPGRPGKPGKPSLPGKPASPIVVRPGFPLSPFKPGYPWGPRAPGAPGKISPHKNAEYITLLTLQGYYIQWHTLETNSKGRICMRVKRVLRNHLA